jgi:hypothetical protein
VARGAVRGTGDDDDDDDDDSGGGDGSGSGYDGGTGGKEREKGENESALFVPLQVLFLTTSTQPYLADRSFVRIHDKFIIIPVADYGTTFLTFKKSLLHQHAIRRDFPVTELARVISKDTPLEFAQGALDECLKIKRRMDFKRRPLGPEEILETLLSNVNLPKKNEIELFQSYCSKLPQEKKRREMLEEMDSSSQKDKN